MRVEVFTLMITKETEMTTKKIYGPWIKWYGGECPVPPDTLVKAKLREMYVLGPVPASRYNWQHDAGYCDDIIEYCIVVEQSDLEAAEKILLANDYTVIPPAKPLTFDDVVPMTEAPPDGTVYWVVSAGEHQGAYVSYFYGRDVDHRAIKRRMAYLAKEHALIAARHIFGLKGGEL